LPYLNVNSQRAKELSAHQAACAILSHSRSRAGLRIDRHAMSEDQFAAEVAGDRDRDDAQHGEQERDGVASAHYARAARRAQVKAGREDDERNDVEACVPVGDLFHSMVFDREPINDAEDGLPTQRR